jgi:hypothetical protein
MRHSYTRRRLLKASTATAIGFGAIGTTAASDGNPDDPKEDNYDQIPPLDLSDIELQLESVSPNGVPEEADGIRPGSQMFIEDDDGTAGCTANFIWRDTTDPKEPLYIGAAGHCFLGNAPASESDARDHEDGDDVSDLSISVCADCTFGGATGLSVIEGTVIELGDVAYARQSNPEKDNDGGVGHDFGLVAIPAEMEEVIDPSLPQFGGPDGVLAGAVPEGELVNQYGAGVANGEVFPTQGSTGVSLGDGGSPESWFSALRASPGDSGSPLVEGLDGGKDGGAAAGILTHLSTNGTAGTTMQRCKEMPDEDNAGFDLEVVQPGEL